MRRRAHEHKGCRGEGKGAELYGQQRGRTAETPLLHTFRRSDERMSGTHGSVQ